MPAPLPLDSYKQSVHDFFDARADYGRSKMHSEMAERLLRLAAPQPGERVLDIATGTGFVAIPAAGLVGQQGSVVGVDISHGMLKQAETAVRDAELSNIELVHADAETLDYPDSSFDLITCCNALPYMANVGNALCRWRSMLRPGGRLVFNCWTEDSHATGRLLRTLLESQGIHLPLIGRETGSPERIRELLLAAGYDRTEVMAEPTEWYLPAQNLGAVFESALKSPLFIIDPADLDRVTALRDTYMEAAGSASTRQDLHEEMGAYFVVAYNPRSAT